MDFNTKIQCSTQITTSLFKFGWSNTKRTSI